MTLPSSGPTITGTTITVSSSYTLNSTTYPVRGYLWVPTSLSASSIDLVVAYHPTIDNPTTTIAQAASNVLSILKDNVGINDKIIFAVAYPQDAISVAQNINLLTQAQLNSFYLGDNLPYAQAALLWAKNNLNSFMSSNSISKTIKDVYMFGHSQGGSLVHKLNTLVQTKGVIANAPGPIRLDETCSANEANSGNNITCNKLFTAYGTANATPLSSNQYYGRSVENYITGHLAPITYTQALDDTTGNIPGNANSGQVYWMTELLSIMQTNGQTYSYYPVPTGGHPAFVQDLYLHTVIKNAVNSTGSQTSLSADQIRDEFGASGVNNSVSLGAYRVSQSVSGLSNLPLDTGVPQGTAAIGFGNLKGKKLNIVVDCGSGTRINAKSRYDNNTSITYIGNFASKPASTAGKKVWIHTNGTIVSNGQSSQTYCSLSTGSFDASTDLIVNIGPSARIYGAGGDGGKGGDQGAGGNDGGSGTSALGVNATNSTTIQISSGAIVYGGGGGGAGGGGATGNSVNKGKGFVTNAGGGGGGGGQGSPPGGGGGGGAVSGGAANYAESAGSAGDGGSLDAAGVGKAGGSATLGDGCQAFGGKGGDGGGFGGSGGEGGIGRGVSSKGYNSSNTSAGGVGPGGYGIVVNTVQTNITYTNNGSVSSIVYNTNHS
jgi:hypothetical protein